MKDFHCDIIRINDNTWRIEDNGVRFFLLTGKEKALLIDTGMNTAEAKEIAESLTDLPLSLLNTHADRDHIAGNDAFASFYMHPAEEAHYRSSGKGGEIIGLHDGDILDLGDRKLKIIWLPGHTPGSVAVLDMDARVLISGDPIQENGRIFMFGGHRNMADYIQSLQSLEKYLPEFDEIWPSHADIPIRPEVIGKLVEGAEKIRDGKIEGKTVDFRGNQIRVYDLGFTAILGNP